MSIKANEMKLYRLIPVIVGSLWVTIALSARAQDPAPDLQDLTGVRGRDGETQLQQRGYEFRWAEQSDVDSYTYWTQNQTGQCIIVRTNNGRYASIVNTSSSDCDQGDPRQSETSSNSTPRALQDLVGARAGQAEGEVERRGYTYQRGEELSNGTAGYWIEGNSGQCVEIITSDGRYQDILYVEWYHCSD